MAVSKIEDQALTCRKQIIKKRWEDGASLAQIGRELGISRNSVLGHVRRMQLPQRTQDAIRQQGRVNAAKQKSKPKAVVLSLQAEAAEPLRIDGELVTSETLHPTRMCKYPIGDVGASDFHFCAALPKVGGPYCEPHARKCFQPQTGISSVNPQMLRQSGIMKALG